MLYRRLVRICNRGHTVRKPTFRKFYRTLTRAARQASRTAPPPAIPVASKAPDPADHLTREEFDIAQSQGFLNADWEFRPTCIRMVREYYDRWPLVRVTFAVDTANNVLTVNVCEALTEQERSERGRKVTAFTHEFPQESLKHTVEAAMTMAKLGMPILTDHVVCAGKVVARKKVMDYKPGMWLMPFTNFNQFFQDHFDLEQIEPDIEDRVRQQFS